MRTAQHSNIWNSESGFTLIELLTYISLASVLFIGVYYVFVKSTDIYVNVLRSSMVIQNAHTASEMIEREAKNVSGKTGISIANSSEFKFTNTSNVVIDLVYSSQQIKKNTVVFAGNVTSFAFTYYKWDGTTWTSALPTSQIAKIRYVFTLSYQGYSFSEDRYILLRNMR